MKGIIFTEFLDLVEEKFGLALADSIMENTDLASGGIYTSVGTYNFSEMLALLATLSAKSNISVDDLLEIYAEHFFGSLKKNYPEIFAKYEEPIEMLASIENHIHVEVRKIYPNAELPSFTIESRTETTLVMIYKSSRAMYSFGRGLMNKTLQHFNCSGTILMEKLKEDGTEVKFSITKNE
ncbi:MAG: hypothetical protein ACI825_000055 [Planctomycetota bacterium]|jgi:hypothetical protein|uniref:heme NO-binding domain-containing protein n=1 Tax=Patiriisocius sp. Uisw_047 TaxID=3230969 RepID=UPI0039ED316B